MFSQTQEEVMPLFFEAWPWFPWTANVGASPGLRDLWSSSGWTVLRGCFWLNIACCQTISSVYNCGAEHCLRIWWPKKGVFFRRIGRHKLVYALPVKADAGRLQASLRYMASGVNFYTLTCMFVSYLGVKEQRSTYLFLCRPWQVYS